MKLEGSGPWSLGDDIALVHTPGHTKVCKLFFVPCLINVEFIVYPISLGINIVLISKFYQWLMIPSRYLREFMDQSLS